MLYQIRPQFFIPIKFECDTHQTFSRSDGISGFVPVIAYSTVSAKVSRFTTGVIVFLVSDSLLQIHAQCLPLHVESVEFELPNSSGLVYEQ